jgi:hypothetical protein
LAPLDSGARRAVLDGVRVPRMRTERAVAVFVLTGAAAFVVLVALLHALQSETNDNDALSEYALGEFGWLMNAAFVAGAVAFAATAFVLARSLHRSASARTGVVVLIIAALGWLLLAAGNIDPEGEKQTTHGLIHGIGFLLGFPAMLIAPFLVARAFGRDHRWRSLRRLTLLFAAAAAFAFLLAFADFAAAVFIRVSVLAVMAWLAYVAVTVLGSWPRPEQRRVPGQ